MEPASAGAFASYPIIARSKISECRSEKATVFIQMHRANQLLKVLAICLSRIKSQENEENDSTETCLFVAFFAIAERVMLVRHHQNYQSLAALNTPLLGSHWQNTPNIESFSAVSSTLERMKIAERETKGVIQMIEADVAEKVLTRQLPFEILELIFTSCDQQELANVSKASRMFQAVAIRLLYRNPRLSSIKALTRLISTLVKSKTNPNWDLSNMVHAITFLPCPEGSLHGVF